MNFTFTPQPLDGVVLIGTRRFPDHRGYMGETYNRSVYGAAGIACDFVQDNQSLSLKRGTIRGLHLQNPPAPQAKLVRVLAGAVFDVAVDVRRGSPTYGRWCGATLTADGGEQYFVPRGFAHGFCTLVPDTIVSYKVDGDYVPSAEAGILWNDPEIGIDWPVDPGEATLSEKDGRLPLLRDFDSRFTA